MDWNAVGAIGESLGAIAVFITLAYLAIQVRSARADVQRSVMQGRLQAARELTMARVSSAGLNDIYAKAIDAMGAPTQPAVAVFMNDLGLSRPEAYRMFANELAWWLYHVQIIPHRHELPPSELRDFEQNTRGIYAPNSLGRLWFENTRPILNPEAVAYVDELLLRP